MNNLTRRNLLKKTGLTAAILGVSAKAAQAADIIQGFGDTHTEIAVEEEWQQKHDRKIKVGIAGYGLCKFGAVFGFQDHPNVEVVAVTDLVPERCQGLSRDCRCTKTYPSLEDMVKDDQIEAIFCATDAPHHAEHCILALNHGKHAACAVPAVFNSVEQAHQLFETVKKTGLNYMMFETSCFHDDLYAMTKLYNSGKLGKLVYSEGEYYHYMPTPLDSYKGWRIGLPPQLYPTHSNAYYCGVTGGSFTEVTCLGMPSSLPQFTPENNAYKNPFGTEIALFRTSEGGMARMAVSWDTPGHHGEMGRIRGQKGSFYDVFLGLENIEIPKKFPLPPKVSAGGHGGSHGYLINEFVMSILENRKPLVDIVMALNMSVSGVIAHQSALKDGETLNIPQFVL
ncbi:MAG: Gfo/Idh/MocA family oxidoreductase [Sedimentisphaerales bacterium]|nr:Gfo/Idh/MocA family oxidoreductase [Sedimentisphaerales bacterium]